MAMLYIVLFLYVQNLSIGKIHFIYREKSKARRLSYQLLQYDSMSGVVITEDTLYIIDIPVVMYFLIN